MKTRLAAAVGHDRAAALACAFLVDTWHSLNAVHEVSAVLLLAGSRERLPALTPSPEIWAQGSGDLGARMERGLWRALDHATAAIVVGSDSPNLPARMFREAAHALERADAVIGPSEDGGFYLLGVRRRHEGLLGELPWSSSSTLQHTRDRLAECGYGCVELAPWYDVDDAGDLARLRRDLARSPSAAPATAALLGVA